MTCAPEERPDATPTGHRVGVEDAESDREDCERTGRGDATTARHALPRPYSRNSYFTSTFTPRNGRPSLFPPAAALRHTR